MLVSVPSSFVQTLRHPQGVMEFIVTGSHEHLLFPGLACKLLQPQACTSNKLYEYDTTRLILFFGRNLARSKVLGGRELGTLDNVFCIRTMI